MMIRPRSTNRFARAILYVLLVIRRPLSYLWTKLIASSFISIGAVAQTYDTHDALLPSVDSNQRERLF